MTPTLVAAEHPDLLARQANATQWLDQTFPDAPRLSTPVRAIPKGAGRGTWSQWVEPDSEVFRVEP